MSLASADNRSMYLVEHWKSSSVSDLRERNAAVPHRKLDPAGIRQAISGDRMVLYAQPIVEFKSGRVAWRELLVRMGAPDGSLWLPGLFLPVAEAAGLMPQIDALVTERGLRLAGNGLRVTINLSAQSLTRGSAIPELLKQARSRGVDPANVMFEITETAQMAAHAEGYDTAAQLADLGCQLALDDFGTGFGCFSYLKHIPAKFLKIDREFIQSAATNLKPGQRTRDGDGGRGC
jgi:EAL domain-containing protein (putative c-di-GMP-specific phosphodiesterase class I)